jgi:phage host-nuclease inhibitor protein Gam
LSTTSRETGDAICTQVACAGREEARSSHAVPALQSESHRVVAVASNEQSDLEDRLARYCEAHPHAADNIDGVRRWWLADPAIPIADVEAALEALVERGTLDVRRLPGSVAIYMNRRR